MSHWKYQEVSTSWIIKFLTKCLFIASMLNIYIYIYTHIYFKNNDDDCWIWPYFMNETSD